MTTTDFIQGFTFPHENAYAPGHYGDPDYVATENVPGDAGGTTRYGIDAASHPGIDIDDLTAEDAINIYLAEFAALHWAISGLLTPALTEFPPASALAFFDCREVCGAHAAWLCAQRALGVEDDGVPGPNTRRLILTAPDQTLANAMIDERTKYHRLVVNSHPGDAKFLQGWLNRCSDLRTFLAS